MEKTVLIGAALPDDKNAEKSMAELKMLAETADCETLAYFLQNVKAYDCRTYVGSGKVAEIKEFIDTNDVTLAIVDAELSGSVTRNLEDELGVTVIDRSRLILDIFAARATSKEGKCQVELAQLKYILPRLSGIGRSLSRLGGGIGTRGPGETKLETDKRHIRARIEHLAEELKEIEKHRGNIRKKRQREEIPVVALVGYTNVGKSSLMNCLTDADAYVENKLFATLDPLMRKLRVSDTLEVVLSDTVGFVSKLPHHLVEAFKSTLEETKYADLILHVVDSSSDEIEMQMQVVDKILSELEITDKPIITVFNKTDVKHPPEYLCTKNTVNISVKNRENIDELLSMIEKKLSDGKINLTLMIPYTEGRILGELYKNNLILEEECTDKGTKVKVFVEEARYNSLKEYIYNE